MATGDDPAVFFVGAALAAKER